MMPLHKACQYGHVRCVEELLKLGGESQILEQNAVTYDCELDQTITHIYVQYGSTCLHWAVKGYVHNKDDKGYKPEAYITIVKNLLGVSSKLLDCKNTVLNSVN
jgi:hypothetical protein